MKIRIKEVPDSHGSQVVHLLDMKEGLDRIEFKNGYRKEVTIHFTTRSDPEVLAISNDLKTIEIESYSI